MKNSTSTPGGLTTNFHSTPGFSYPHARPPKPIHPSLGRTTGPVQKIIDANSLGITNSRLLTPNYYSSKPIDVMSIDSRNSKGSVHSRTSKNTQQKMDGISQSAIKSSDFMKSLMYKVKSLEAKLKKVENAQQIENQRKLLIQYFEKSRDSQKKLKFSKVPESLFKEIEDILKNEPSAYKNDAKQPSAQMYTSTSTHYLKNVTNCNRANQTQNPKILESPITKINTIYFDKSEDQQSPMIKETESVTDIVENVKNEDRRVKVLTNNSEVQRVQKMMDADDTDEFLSEVGESDKKPTQRSFDKQIISPVCLTEGQSLRRSARNLVQMKQVISTKILPIPDFSSSLQKIPPEGVNAAKESFIKPPPKIGMSSDTVESRSSTPNKSCVPAAEYGSLKRLEYENSKLKSIITKLAQHVDSKIYMQIIKQIKDSR